MARQTRQGKKMWEKPQEKWWVLVLIYRMWSKNLEFIKIAFYHLCCLVKMWQRYVCKKNRMKQNDVFLKKCGRRCFCRFSLKLLVAFWRCVLGWIWWKWVMGRSNLKFKGPTVKKLFSNRKLGLQIHQRGKDGKDTLTVIAAMFIPLVRCTTWKIYMELIMQFQAVRVYFYNCSDSFYLQQTATVSRNLSTAPWTISTASEIQVVPRLLNQRKPPKEAKWQATKNWCSPKRLADVTAGSEVDFIS